MAFLLKQEITLAWKNILWKRSLKSEKINELKLIQRLYSSNEKVLPYKIIDANSGDAVFKLGNNFEVLEYCQDSRIRYNSYIQKYKWKGPKYIQKKIKSDILLKRKKSSYENSLPLIIEQLYAGKVHPLCGSNTNEEDGINSQETYLHDSSEQFPYAECENVNIDAIPKDNFSNTSNDDDSFSEKQPPSISDDISVRLKAYNEKKEIVKSFPQVVKHPEDDKNLELRFYEDTLLSDLTLDNDEIETYVNQHGTPDPSIPKSSVPCGGCGSHLHCQNEGLPGYTPCEVFKGKNNGELRSVICQRCFFLKAHNAALNVRVSPDVYEEALRPIAAKKALVLAIIDVIDTPCSIWPGLYDLIGGKQPVVVVGNKVDLLPRDSYNNLKNIKTSLIESIKSTTLWKAAINHICLVSAKTGYGIEDLITEIQMKWGIGGDIYIVGCTNAGKSTLFNALLRSDLCKVQASNLIRRATASPWPGTTLNLLKFPLFNPTGARLASRKIRLKVEEQKRNDGLDQELPANRNGRRQASLTGYVGKTFMDMSRVVDVADPFKINPHRIPKDTLPIMGINEKSREYIKSKWCFDTPGTVQPDQFLGLLTHDELMDVVPRIMIVPRTFVLHPSQSLFVAGLGRVDYLYGYKFIWVAVCCSDQLPVTIVPTCEASAVYRSYLGTKLLHVPRGSEQRLQRWPPLKPVNVRLLGKGRETAADIVLSSAGFVSITSRLGVEMDLRCWTPGGRGIYLRSPSMLPDVCALGGKRIEDTPAHRGIERSHLYQSS